MKPLCLYLIIWSIYVSLPACHAQPQTGIKGTILLDRKWKPMVYLIQPRHFSEIAADYLGQLVDSATIAEDGTFSFTSILTTTDKTVMLIVLQKTGSKFPNHLSDEIPSEDNYMPFVLTKGDQLIFTADASAFQKTFSLEQLSKENHALLTLRNIRITAFQKFLAPQDAEAENDTLLLEREKLYQAYANALMEFADSTTCLEAALVAIRWISPTGDYERIPEFIVGQCEKWSEIHRENIFIQELCKAAEREKLPLLLGDIVPDYPLPLVDGDTIMISKLLGKKMTILDIWASWCAPCRKENRMVLAPLWSSYKNKGLQIIGYSLDANASSWKSAISGDGAGWIHASHLSGDTSPFLEVLGITTLPANFLLNGDGRVIAKNLHGEELAAFIKEHVE